MSPTRDLFHPGAPEASSAAGLGLKPGSASGRPRTKRRETLIRYVFVGAGLFSVVVMGLIVVFLFKEGLGLFGKYGVGHFLFGVDWYPTDEAKPDFGILPLIVGSLAVTGATTLIAVPLGVGAALYLGEVAGPRVREWVKPGVELLASLPSVVLGFLGMVVLAPLLQQWFDVPSGLNVLSASLMLSLMAIPTIASISEDALYAVPQDLVEASLALGATRWETLVRVKIPGALAGIGTAVILGMNRAMGETMVVLMVAGGAAQFPTSLLDSVRPMPATIAAEMGETPVGSDHYFALFAIGIVLFLMTLAFNLVAAWVSRRFTQKGAATL